MGVCSHVMSRHISICQPGFCYTSTYFSTNGHCTEMHFASFLSAGFICWHNSKSTGKETGKTHLCALTKCTVDRRIFLPFWSQDFKNYDAIYSRSKSSDKLSEEYLCLAKKSKLLFWRRRLCVRPSVRLSECLSVFLQTRKFGEQTSRILEFKPEGLES